jgi:hypothetical protein
MNQTGTTMKQQKSDASVTRVAMNLEVDVIPVSDVERSKQFYQLLGWRLDADDAPTKNVRIVQFTPPGSGCSVTFGRGITAAAPGSAAGALIVSDIKAAHDELIRRGIAASETWHGASFPVEARIPGLVAHIKRRGVLGFHLAPIVNACGGNVGTAEPFLDLGDISFMIQGGGGGRSTQRVRTDLEAEGQGIAANEFVDAVGGDGVVEFAGAVVAYGRNRVPSVSAAWRASSKSLCSLRVSRWRIRCHSRMSVRNTISAFRRLFAIILLVPHLFWRSSARRRTSLALGVGSSRSSCCR